MDYQFYRDRQSCLLLVDEVGIEVPIRRSVCVALKLQAQAGVDFKLKDPFETISDIVHTSLDAKFIPPSEAQVNYVYVIAGALSLPVTPDTVATKSSCHEFISTYVDDFRRRFEKTDNVASKPKKKHRAVSKASRAHSVVSMDGATSETNDVPTDK
jgi:urocanate hydratase